MVSSVQLIGVGSFFRLPGMSLASSALLGVFRCDADVVDVDKYEIESTELIMHKSLECLCCSAQAKRHLGEFE